jgi:beta-aspartyl-peptidase (threonine type)
MSWFRPLMLLALAGTLATPMIARSTYAAEKYSDVVLAVHGGTGMAKAEMTQNRSQELRAALEKSLRAGYERLNKPDSTSLDAVEVAIRLLEDSPLFNAGKGAVFTHDGRNELDASIMEGKTLKAGAVAGVTRIKNPITAARAVMERSKHVMLVGEGANVFARDLGLEIVEPSYFRTEERWQQLQKAIQAERSKDKQSQAAGSPPREWSTVGAVAVDRAGNLAAGTSTGGMTNKRFGRVGDSPIIGAGTYADNESCAISCTGHGEYFIRYAVSHSIASLVKYKGLDVQAAAEEAINKTLREAGGEGACIVLDRNKNFAPARNSEGLYRGWITTEGIVKVKLYDE